MNSGQKPNSGNPESERTETQFDKSLWGQVAPSTGQRHAFAHFEVEIGPDGKPVELGQGAMGVTYKAMDLLLRRPVALKVISSRMLENESLKSRFIREARAAASFRHPNIASVYYLGSTELSYFYAMELVAGQTVEDLIATRAPLDITLSLEIGSQVASALAAAHQAGIVHRDIKPANLIVSFDEKNHPTVKVIDFGLVKLTAEISDDSSVSEAGVFLGTPRYASPEQFGDGRVDIRSDMYALGIVLWEMLTGTTPFNGSTTQVAFQHLQAALPMRQLRHLPQPIVALLTHLLEKDPADRPQTPEELLAVLKVTARGLGTLQAVLPVKRARTSPPPRRPRKPRRGTQFREVVERKLLLEPWDFGPLLAEKFRGFTGREWLFQEIEEWRQRASSAALLIVGEPGVGKSAIVSALVHRNAGGQVLAYHCCRADTPATLEPAGFVRSLAAMFSMRLAEYAALLAGSSFVDNLRGCDTDPISAFEACILAPLHKIQPPAGQRSYLLIDSLDEALTRLGRPTIVEVLSTRLDRLPAWLGIVATTRNDPSVLSQLRGLRAHILSAQDPRNQEDVRRFIQNRLAQPSLRDQAIAGGKIVADLEKDLLRSGAGNFLFVTTALNAVESGQLSFDQIENLPPGLSSLYENFFHRLFRDAEVDFAVSRRVLETMAAARESLNREQIAAAADADGQEEFPSILSRLASFMPASDGRYAFFHKSMFDWLTGWDKQHDQPFAGAYHVDLRKGWIRLANWCWAEYQNGLANLSLYSLRHLPTHLQKARRDQDLRTVLSDFNFLQAKLKATDERALIADYEYLPATADLRLVQSALRLSAHVLAEDRAQLAGQIMGRLLGNPSADIQVLLKGASASEIRPWLRPLTPSLAPPGGPMIRTFAGHTDWVRAVGLTPDGRSAISGSWDCTLRIWDLDGGQSVRTLEGHTDWVTAVAVTFDGKRIVSAGADRTLRVWDLESGRLIRTLEGHTDRVNAVAVTPDGRYAVSASADQTLRVWDLHSGQLRCSLEGHLAAVNAVAMTSDSRAAVSASSDHTLRVWDLENGRMMRTFEGHLDWVNAVAITLDDRRVISGSADQTLRIWDFESGQLLSLLGGHTNSVTAVALVPDGLRVISASADHTLRIWDLEKAKSVRILTGHTDWVTAVEVSSDRRRAVSASADHTLRMWDLEGEQSVLTLPGHADSVTAVALMADGLRVALVSDNHLLHLWDLESGQLLRTLKDHADWVTAVAVTSNGPLAISGAADGSLRLWNLESERPMLALEGHTSLISAVAVTVEGRQAISASADRTIRIWDLESGQSLRTLESSVDLVSAVVVTSGGRRAFWGSDAGALLVWDSELGQIVRIGESDANWVTAVAITPNGRRGLSASTAGTLRLWDLESGRLLRTLEDRAEAVNSIAMTPDGKRAISASSDRTLRVWDIESGTCLAAFTGESPMLRCAVATDGRTIVAREKSGRGHFLRLEGLD